LWLRLWRWLVGCLAWTGHHLPELRKSRFSVGRERFFNLIEIIDREFI